MSIIKEIKRGNYENVRAFLEDGNDPNAFYGTNLVYGQRGIVGRGELPLHLAINLHQVEIAKLLLDYNADPYLENYHQANALDVAVYDEVTDIIRELLDRGMDANIKNTGGATPMEYADDINVIELLLEYGADINNKSSKTGNTRLHFAVGVMDVELVIFLLKHGADVFITNNENMTPLQRAEDLLQQMESRGEYTESSQIMRDIIKIIESYTPQDLKEPDFDRY